MYAAHAIPLRQVSLIKAKAVVLPAGKTISFNVEIQLTVISSVFNLLLWCTAVGDVALCFTS